MNAKVWKRAIGCGLLAVVVAGGAWAAEAAAEPEKVDLTYLANAMSLRGGPGPSTGLLRVHIDRWTTDEERAELIETLANEGSRKLATALFETKRVGYIRFSNTLGYDLRYARQMEADGKRHVIVATDRPILAAEVMNNTRSQDNGITLIRLTFAAGSETGGEGVMLVGAQLSLDGQTRELTIESLSSNPIQLTEVRKD
jgi:hypothetical protein